MRTLSAIGLLLGCAVANAIHPALGWVAIMGSVIVIGFLFHQD